MIKVIPSCLWPTPRAVECPDRRIGRCSSGGVVRPQPTGKRAQTRTDASRPRGRPRLLGLLQSVVLNLHPAISELLRPRCQAAIACHWVREFESNWSNHPATWPPTTPPCPPTHTPRGLLWPAGFHHGYAPKLTTPVLIGWHINPAQKRGTDHKRLLSSSHTAIKIAELNDDDGGQWWCKYRRCLPAEQRYRFRYG